MDVHFRHFHANVIIERVVIVDGAAFRDGVIPMGVCVRCFKIADRVLEQHFGPDQHIAGQVTLAGIFVVLLDAVGQLRHVALGNGVDFFGERVKPERADADGQQHRQHGAAQVLFTHGEGRRQQHRHNGIDAVFAQQAAEHAEHRVSGQARAVPLPFLRKEQQVGGFQHEQDEQSRVERILDLRLDERAPDGVERKERCDRILHTTGAAEPGGKGRYLPEHPRTDEKLQYYVEKHAEIVAAQRTAQPEQPAV